MKKSFMERMAAFIVDKRRLFVVLFAVAAAALLIGYASSDSVAYVHPWYTITVAAMALGLGLSLLIAQNEKCLPPERRQK